MSVQLHDFMDFTQTFTVNHAWAICLDYHQAIPTRVYAYFLSMMHSAPASLCGAYTDAHTRGVGLNLHYAPTLDNACVGTTRCQHVRTEVGM